MKTFGAILILLSICGCASYSSHHTHLTATGTYLYNGIPVTGNMAIDGYSCVGFKCPTVNMTEYSNADSGPALNSAK